MQETEKYKFNLIEMSDAFGPEKLNENTQKLEDALIAHENTVAAAMSQHKSDTTATINAVEKGAKLVHLAGPVNGSGGTVSVSLSGVNISQYRALLVFVRNNSTATFSAGSMSVSIGMGVSVVWIFTEGQGQDNLVAFTGGTATTANAARSSVGTSWWSVGSISCGPAAYFMDVYGLKV